MGGDFVETVPNVHEIYKEFGIGGKVKSIFTVDLLVKLLQDWGFEVKFTRHTSYNDLPEGMGLFNARRIRS